MGSCDCNLLDGGDSNNYTNMTFETLQTEVAEWANRNFPMAMPHHPLLGAQEEVGELSHAHLKQEQGIRGTFVEHQLAKIDAVADIVIYLADYCQRNGIDMNKSIETTWAKVKLRDWQKNKHNGEVA